MPKAVKREEDSRRIALIAATPAQARSGILGKEGKREVVSGGIHLYPS